MFPAKRVPIFKSPLFREKGLLETTKFQKSYGLNRSFRTQKITNKQQQQQQQQQQQFLLIEKLLFYFFSYVCNVLSFCSMLPSIRTVQFNNNDFLIFSHSLRTLLKAKYNCNMYYSHSYNAPPTPTRKKYFHRKNQQSPASTEQYINGDILRRDP